MKTAENSRLLLDFFPQARATNDEEPKIMIDGKTYNVFYSLSPEVSDDVCNRIRIDRKYYYFSLDDFRLWRD